MFAHNCDMTRGQRFEKKFKEVTLEFIERKKLKKKVISDKAWPGDAKADNKIQRIAGTQAVTLADAFQLAEALNYDFIDWMEKVLKAFEEEERTHPLENHLNSA
jgi:hypothetical protein